MAGVPPIYTVNDELRCLLIIPEEGISRAALTEKLGLGEGSVRSILDDLKQKKLIDSTQNGHFLTERGKTILESFQKRITLPELIDTPVYSEKKAVGLIVHSQVKEEQIIPLRDHAIKRGADAAIIVGAEEIDAEVKKIKEKMGWKEGNTLVVCFAEKEQGSMNAALAVAQQIDKVFASEVALALEF